MNCGEFSSAAKKNARNEDRKRTSSGLLQGQPRPYVPASSSYGLRRLRKPQDHGNRKSIPTAKLHQISWVPQIDLRRRFTV
jgi:hypothetical protein